MSFDSYGDTLSSMKTGTGSSRLNKLKGAFTWNQQSEVSARSEGFMGFSWNGEPKPFYDTFGLTMTQRYVAFAGCIIGAVLMFLLAFLHLPLAILRPSKFVVPYCFANIFLFVSFGFLQGFVSYSRHLFFSEKWPFSVIYIFSTLTTIYCAWWLRWYSLTIPTAIFQFVSTICFIISYIPGGSSGLGYIGSVLSSSFFRSQFS